MITPDTLAEAWANAQPGDVLKLEGRFYQWRPRRRSFDPPVTIDATNAEMVEFYGSDLSGISFVGGTWIGESGYKTGCRIDNGSNLSFRNMTLRSWALVGDGLRILGGSNIAIDGIDGTGFKNGINLARVDGFSIRNFTLYGMESDGIDVHNCQNGVIEGGSIRDSARQSDTHPDGIQFASQKDYPRCSNIIVRRVTVHGAMQGICGFNHPRVGQQGFENIAVEDCDVEVSYPHGIAFYDVEGLTLRNNRVRTLEGSSYQARINIMGCTDVVREGNTIAAHDKRPAINDEPPAPAEPEVIEITLKPGQRLVVKA